MTDARGVVVLVEDDVGMKQAIERLLAASGFIVRSFESAEEALKDSATLDARCLVLDIHLPGISGFEMYDRLVATGRTPPVVFITGHDDARNKDRARRLRALGYLVKPFSGRDLAALVAKAFAMPLSSSS